MNRKMNMATQIMPTLPITAKQAKQILKSLNKTPTEKSIKNGQKLIDFFSNVERK